MMNQITTALLELLKYCIPAIIVLVVAYLLISKFLNNEIDRKRLALFSDHVKTTLPLRLQAYERLALFLERINVQDLMGKLYQTDKSAQDVQIEMIKTIRSEFEYNLSQQIYVSNEIWKTIVTAKEQEIAMINQIASTLPPGASAKEFFTRITEFVLTQEDDTPRLVALDILKDEAKNVLIRG